jgi:hypothetical protein
MRSPSIWVEDSATDQKFFFCAFYVGCVAAMDSDLSFNFQFQTDRSPAAPQTMCQMPYHQLLFARMPKARLEAAQACCASQTSTHQPSPSTSGPSAGAHNPGFGAVNSLLGLSNDDYLHKLPQKDVFIQLIDCFRMRMEDEYTFKGDKYGFMVVRALVHPSRSSWVWRRREKSYYPAGGTRRRDRSAKGLLKITSGQIFTPPWRSRISLSIMAMA